MSAADPVIRVEHGRPSPDELAVVTALLLARLRAEALDRPAELPRAGWSVNAVDQAGSWAGPYRAVWQTAV